METGQSVVETYALVASDLSLERFPAVVVIAEDVVEVAMNYACEEVAPPCPEIDRPVCCVQLLVELSQVDGYAEVQKSDHPTSEGVCVESSQVLVKIEVPVARRAEWT